MNCPNCNSSPDNIVLVASGVDEQGEWRSAECEYCGYTWLIKPPAPKPTASSTSLV